MQARIQPKDGGTINYSKESSDDRQWFSKKLFCAKCTKAILRHFDCQSNKLLHDLRCWTVSAGTHSKGQNYDKSIFVSSRWMQTFHFIIHKSNTEHAANKRLLKGHERIYNQPFLNTVCIKSCQCTIYHSSWLKAQVCKRGIMQAMVWGLPLFLCFPFH